MRPPREEQAMKKIVVLMVVLSFLLSCALAEEDDFLLLSRLDEMKAYLDEGMMVNSIVYDAVAYSPEPFKALTVTDPEIASELAKEVLDWKISGRGFLRTDFYPNISFHLANGKNYTLYFCWDSLQVDNEYYQIADDAVSVLISEIQDAAEQE